MDPVAVVAIAIFAFTLGGVPSGLPFFATAAVAPVARHPASAVNSPSCARTPPALTHRPQKIRLRGRARPPSAPSQQSDEPGTAASSVKKNADMVASVRWDRATSRPGNRPPGSTS